MNKRILLFLFSICFFSNVTHGQSTEKPRGKVAPVTGIEFGILGTDLYHEQYIDREWALRYQIGLINETIGYRSKEEPNFAFSLMPSVSVSPKWYYNIGKRGLNGKNVKNNAANFVLFNFGYATNRIRVSNLKEKIMQDPYFPNQTYLQDAYKKLDLIYLTPSWGLRRSFCKNYTYEFKIGAGAGIFMKKDETKLSPTFDITFKIGYVF